jgi:hypothetical protein
MTRGEIWINLLFDLGRVHVDVISVSDYDVVELLSRSLPRAVLYRGVTQDFWCKLTALLELVLLFEHKWRSSYLSSDPHPTLSQRERNQISSGLRL